MKCNPTEMFACNVCGYCRILIRWTQQDNYTPICSMQEETNKTKKQKRVFCLTGEQNNNSFFSLALSTNSQVKYWCRDSTTEMILAKLKRGNSANLLLMPMGTLCGWKDKVDMSTEFVVLWQKCIDHRVALLHSNLNKAMSAQLSPHLPVQIKKVNFEVCTQIPSAEKNAKTE